MTQLAKAHDAIITAINALRAEQVRVQNARYEEEAAISHACDVIYNHEYEEEARYSDAEYTASKEEYDVYCDVMAIIDATEKDLTAYIRDLSVLASNVHTMM